MNANIKGYLLVKGDRLNTRVEDFAKYFLKTQEENEKITKDDFKDFVKSMHLIINTEMNERGVEKRWRK